MIVHRAHVAARFPHDGAKVMAMQSGASKPKSDGRNRTRVLDSCPARAVRTIRRAATLLVFAIIRLLPGNVVMLMMSEQGYASDRAK